MRCQLAKMSKKVQLEEVEGTEVSKVFKNLSSNAAQMLWISALMQWVAPKNSTYLRFSCSPARVRARKPFARLRVSALPSRSRNGQELMVMLDAHMERRKLISTRPGMNAHHHRRLEDAREEGG